jgi:uncharacterized protein (DUF305 family)
MPVDDPTKGSSVTKKRSVAIGAVAFAALVALAACGDSGGDQAGQGTTSASPTTTSAAAEAHNQADVMFAQHMIPHHQQAIEMSDMILAKQGIDPRVVDLANQIKAAQGPEIEQMQDWLKEWGQPTMPMMPGPGMPGQTGMPGMPGQTGMPGMPSPSATPTTTDPHHTSTPSETGMPSPSAMPGMPGPGGMPGMSEMPGMPGMPMAGMMSAEDMAALQNAQGVEASKLFLTQMIEHHQGAITMAQTEIDSGQSHPAITLAQSIIDAQQKEITTMQGILATL